VAPPLLTIPPGGAALDSAIQCGPAAQAAERKRAEAARLKEEEKLRKREEAELAKRQLAEAEAERRRVEQVRHRWPIARSLALRPQSALPDVAIISVGPIHQEEKEQRDRERKAKKEAKRAIRLAKKAEAIAAGLPADPGDFPQQPPRACIAVATTHAQAIRTFRC
jgi:hypothetical protein